MLVRVSLAVGGRRRGARVRRALAERAVLVETLAPGDDPVAHLARRPADLLVVRRGRVDAAAVAAARALPERPEVVVLTDREDSGERAALLAAGCLAVVDERLPDAALAETLRALLRRRRDEAVGRLSAIDPQAPGRLDDFVSRSPAMRAFLEVARRVVPSDASLLILGETGVGKERLARAIHVEGPRGAGPFLPVHCSALSESLLESELFGHEEGAFTGATRARRGLFELAHRGTIFLHEVGELSPAIQAKLLRVVQEREFLAVGGESPVRVDVRVMAATNRDLAAEVEAGRFRADLYYRLCVVSLTLPPLRARREDVPTLVESYVEHFRTRLGRGATAVAPEALAALERHDWPGNVRELVNAVERAVLLGTGPRLELGDLPAPIAAPDAPAPLPVGPAVATPTELPWAEARARALADFERAYFARQLEAAGGRVGEAARRAGIDPRSLYDKLRRHGLRAARRGGGPPAATPGA